MRFNAIRFFLTLVALLSSLVPLVLGGGLLVLVVRRLKKDAQSAGESVSPPQSAAGYSQELLAERLGVSRQAVSKWETGAAEPSTSNLLALAKLYGVDPGDLLRGVQ